LASDHRDQAGRAFVAVIVEEVAPRYPGWTLALRVGQRANSGKGILDVMRGNLRLGEKVGYGAKQVFDLLGRRSGLSRVAVVSNFCRADENLIIPGQNKNWTPIGRLGIQRRGRRAGETPDHDV